MSKLWLAIALFTVSLNDVYSKDNAWRANVVYYVNQTITYRLPGDAELTAGPPVNRLIFRKKRPAPIGSSIVNVGLGQPEVETGLYKSIVSLDAWRLSQFYFADDFNMDRFEEIMVKEKMSLNPDGFIVRQIVSVNSRKWQELTLYATESKQGILARSYSTPIDGNTVLIVRVNLKLTNSVKTAQEALLVVDQIVDSIRIEKLKAD